MYDVLFIDDKFEEIKDTFWALQNEHIRCFYSDGEKNLPKNNKEKLPFKNLKFICLDLHLENRGITTLKNDKNIVSTLASVVKSFIDEGSNATIIINTSFIEEFDTVKNNFIKYLGFTPDIKTEEKSQKNSTLHKQEIKKDIKENSHQSILRNLVIREAIEIENLIFEVIKTNFSEITNKDIKKVANNFKKGFHFSHKIKLFNMFNSNLSGELKKLRELRNRFAHDTTPPVKNLLDLLEKIEELKQKINL